MRLLKTRTTTVVILLAILVLSPTMSPIGATDTQGEPHSKVFLPFVATSTATSRVPSDIPVYEYTVRVHLAHFEYGTCRDIVGGTPPDDPPLDGQTRIEVYRLETKVIVAEAHGQVEHTIREDEVRGFGFHTYHEAPRSLCPNLFRHEEKWANINGVYEFIDVYVYDPTG